MDLMRFVASLGKELAPASQYLVRLLGIGVSVVQHDKAKEGDEPLVDEIVKTAHDFINAVRGGDMPNLNPAQNVTDATALQEALGGAPVVPGGEGQAQQQKKRVSGGVEGLHADKTK